MFSEVCDDDFDIDLNAQLAKCQEVRRGNDGGKGPATDLSQLLNNDYFAKPDDDYGMIILEEAHELNPDEDANLMH